MIRKRAIVFLALFHLAANAEIYSSVVADVTDGLFGTISGAPASNMFLSTFSGCSNLTGESALMPDGVTHLYDQFPTASRADCQQCYYGAPGLNDYATMPDAWK